MSVERLATLVGSALLAGLLGYLIKERQMMDLVAGYDAEQFRDEEGLAAFVGTHLYYVAALTLVMSAVDYLGFRLAWIPYAVVLLALVVRLLRGSRQFR
ncbi:DUF3784 domain-containing protein [Halorussus halobius]|uniref:DUF3784 domain-containing protein n=1 Tax=Halorussus halobius TaxID=1710537 RepID=UPI0010927E1E|nr:DUF3784 domain-containing protein [Halorussus halobius]